MSKVFANLLLTVTILISSLFYLLQGRNSTVFYGDALGYYLYLPTSIIYHNLGKPETLPENKGIDRSINSYIADMIAQQPESAKGFLVNQYTYGTAFFELPFFATVHLFQILSGGNTNGFAAPYSNAIRLSSVFYLLLGLYFLFRSLLEFVQRNVAIAASCFLLIGSNLFWFSFYQAGMAHMPLFFLYALLLFLTIRLHKHPQITFFVFAGLAAGFITVIRPSDVLCLLIPLLYGVYNRASLAAKIQFVKTNYRGMAIAILCFVIPLIPQLLYWEKYTGSFVYDSYVGQSFDFLHPKIIEGLFGFKNGWLAYSPLMIFSLAGLLCFAMYKKLIPVIAVLLPVYIYVIYSWWSYNYINGFGSRPMIHLYPLLAVPFSALLQWVSARYKIGTVLLVSVLMFCSFVNIKQSFQQAKDELWSEESNATFNLQTLFKSKLSYNDLVVFDCAETQPKRGFAGTLLSAYEMNLTDSVLQTDYVHIKSEQEFLPAPLEHYTSASETNTKWLRISGIFNVPEMVYDLYKNHLLVTTVTRNDQTVIWKSVKINNKIGLADSSCLAHTHVQLRHYDVNQWGPVHFYIPLSNSLKEGDKINVYVWNIGRSPLLVKQLKLELYSE